MVINGKSYPEYDKVMEMKDMFVGGTLFEIDHYDVESTKIVNIDLIEHDEDSAWFCVYGVDFNCGFDVNIGGGISNVPYIRDAHKDSFHFYMMYGGQFSIEPKEEEGSPILELGEIIQIPIKIEETQAENYPSLNECPYCGKKLCYQGEATDNWVWVGYDTLFTYCPKCKQNIKVNPKHHIDFWIEKNNE